MRTDTHVCFYVWDFGDDPDVVSSIMGIYPTMAWVKGDRFGPNLKARRLSSGWKLESGLGKAEPLEAHLEALLSKLEPLREQIQQAARRFPVEIKVAQYFREVNPGYQLEPRMLSRLASLGLTIDFDQYCLPEDEDHGRRATSP